MASLMAVSGVVSASPDAFVYAAETNNAQTDTVSVNMKTNKKLDVVLTKGTSTLDLSNFKSDLLTALSKEGVNTNNVNISAIDTTQTDMQNSFSWNRDMSSSIGNITTGTNNVSMVGNSRNLGKNCLYAFPTQQGNNYDFSLGYNISFGDSFNAAGMLLKVQKSGNYLTGYMLSFNNRNTFKTISGTTGAIWKFKWQIGTNTSNMTCYNSTTAPGVNQCQLVKSLALNTSGTLNVNVDKTSITVAGGGLSTTKIATDSSYTGTGFGFFSDHYSHSCNNIGAFNLTTIGLDISSKKSYSDVLKSPAWRPNAVHVVVNATDEIEEDFTTNAKLASVLSKTLNDDIDYIGWGCSTNKASNDMFITQNQSSGLSLSGATTTAARYNTFINETASYIKTLMTEESISDYVLQGDNVNLEVEPSNLLTNTATNAFPAGRWYIKHDPNYFANPTGEAKYTGYYMSDLQTDFSQTGSYEIYFADKLVKKVYVHRKPTANFQLSKSGTSLTLTSTSYDVDGKNNSKGLGKGIIEEEWKYKDIDASSWTTGKLSTIPSGKTYVIQLRVKDEQSQWSDAVTKYISGDSSTILNPEANFDFGGLTSISKYKTLSVINNSYDPNGLTLSSYRWTVKKDGTALVTNASSPITSFSSYGAGTYEYSLTVVNSSGKVSDEFTRTLTVTEDTSAPKVEADKISADWNTGTKMTFTCSDDESGFKNVQYAVSESTEIPTNGWSALSTSNVGTVNLTEDGRWYVHVKATDNKGNVANKVLGPYNIDTSNPTATDKLSTNEYTKDDVSILIKATDDMSGVQKIVAPDGTEVNKDEMIYPVKDNGTYTFTLYDNLNHVSTHTVTVSNIDKNAPKVEFGTSKNTTNKITVSWNADDFIATSKDAKSEIAGYIYSVDDDANGNPLDTGISVLDLETNTKNSLVTAGTTEDTSIELSTDSQKKYFHVVAVDKAGNTSSVYTIRIGQYAANKLINSTSSNFDTDYTGEDKTQGQLYNEVEIQDITDTTYSKKSNTEVYATRTSTFSVTIPKVITLDGQSKVGSYQVKVKGDIAGSQEVSVTTPSDFTMSEQNAGIDKKADVKATIYNNAKTTWNQAEIAENEYLNTAITENQIEAKDITAGSWMGTFDFNIQLTYSPEDNSTEIKNSETSTTDIEISGTEIEN